MSVGSVSAQLSMIAKARIIRSFYVGEGVITLGKRMILKALLEVRLCLDRWLIKLNRELADGFVLFFDQNLQGINTI
jgi:hypothetical protein